MSEERITSRQNPLLRHVKKLLASRAYRAQCGMFAADGVKLLEEAVRWCRELETVILSDKVAAPNLPDGVRCVRVPEDVMRSLSAMSTPQGALFVCRFPRARALAMRPGTLVLDGVQDPGNVGTILRTADAFNVPVVLTQDCADPYGAKTVRASMGAVFRSQPFIAGREEILAACRQSGVELAVSVLSGQAADIRRAALERCAVVIGSEGQGVGPLFRKEADRQFIIPMNPRCESLNAAIAAGIILWQMKFG